MAKQVKQETAIRGHAPRASRTDAELGAAMVEKVLELRELVQEHRARLREARRAGPADGTPVAGGAHKALLEAGAHLVDGPHRLRWPLDQDGLNDRQGHAGVKAIVLEVLAMLSRVTGDDELLADVAAHWPSCRTRAEADAVMQAVREPRAAASTRAAAAAHAQAMAKKDPAKVPAPPPKPGAAAPPPGEWVEGEYVRDDFRESRATVG
jgi:hypothetical protein